MLDVEWTFRMINVLQQRRPGEKGSPLQKEPFHDLQKKGINGLVEWGVQNAKRSGAQKAKDAKIAKMHVFVHFAKFPCEKWPKKGPSRGTPLRL